MLSVDLRQAASAARLCADAPAHDLRATLMNFGDLLERAADEAAYLETEHPLKWSERRAGAFPALRERTHAGQLAIDVLRRSWRIITTLAVEAAR
jgi:hypothetical protein